MPDPKLQIILAAKDVTKRALTQFQGRIAAITKSVFSFKGALGALTGAGGIGILISRSVAAADAVAKTADKLGISTTALQEYRYAAERSGVETRTLDMALQRFTRRVAEAAQGKGELRGVLEQYNIAVRDAQGNTRRTEDVFRQLAETIRNVENPAERLRIAFKAFDSEGAALVNMLRDGSAGLDAFADRAQKLGVVLDDSLTRGAEGAQDAMDDLGKVIEVNFSRVVLENVESITAAVEKLAGALGKVSKYAGLESISGTRMMGYKLGLEGRLDWEKFKEMDYLERQRVVEEILGGRLEFGAGGQHVVRKKIGAQPAPAITAPGATTAAAAAVYGPKTSMKYATQGAGGIDYGFVGRNFGRGAGEVDRFGSPIEASREAYDEMERHVRDYRDTVDGTYTYLDQRVSTSFGHATDALADFVTQGKFNFNDFSNSLINDLIRIQSRMALTGLFNYAVGGLSSAFAGGAAAPVHVGAGGTTAFKFHGGGHLGEPVAGVGLRSGSSYEFNANETVMPDSKLGAGGTTIVYNISAMDAKSFVEFARRTGAVPLLASENLDENGLLRQSMMRNL